MDKIDKMCFEIIGVFCGLAQKKRDKRPLNHPSRFYTDTKPKPELVEGEGG